jgi:hypothetical protein
MSFLQGEPRRVDVSNTLSNFWDIWGHIHNIFGVGKITCDKRFNEFSFHDVTRSCLGIKTSPKGLIIDYIFPAAVCYTKNIGDIIIKKCVDVVI